MRKRTKNNGKKIAISIVVIALAIVLGLFLFTFFGLNQESAFPSAGAQFIPNPQDQYANYTRIATSFTDLVCNNDECIVFAEMTLSKPQSQESWGCLKVPNSPRYTTKESCQASPLRGACGTCEKESDTIYKGRFDFCPIPNTPYCPGNDGVNLITSKIPTTVATDTFKVKRGTQIQFDPKYTNSTPVTSWKVYFRDYDLSCSSDLITPTKPTGKVCEAGMIKCDGNYYYTCDTSKKITVGSSQCFGFSTTRQTVPSGQDCYIYNAAYESTKTEGYGLGELGCLSQTAANTCTFYGNIPERTKLTDTTYKQCTTVTTNGVSCNVWGTQEYFCPPGTLFNEGTKKCALPQTGTCSPIDPSIPILSGACVSLNSKNIYKCEEVIKSVTYIPEGVQTLKGYRLQLVGTACPGNELCKYSNQLNVNDICSCDVSGANQCTKGAIQCGTGQNQYRICDGAPSNSCYRWSSYQNTKIGEVCINNTLQVDPKAGCASGTKSCDATSGLKCGKDLGLSVGDPYYNTCICDSKTYNNLVNLPKGLGNYNSSDMRCNGAQRQEINKIGPGSSEGDSESCFIWKDFGNICDIDQICIENK